MNTRPHIISGRSSDTPLTENGMKQARRLGGYLSRQGVTPSRVHVSPALRTIRTAEVALETMGLGMEPIIDEELHELDSGDWVGAVRSEKYTQAVQEQITKQGKDFKPPGGESMNDVGRRMLRWLNHNTDGGIRDDGRVFVFTHGVAIRCLASALHGWTQSETYHTAAGNVSISLFKCENGRWRLEYIGRTPFAT